MNHYKPCMCLTGMQFKHRQSTETEQALYEQNIAIVRLKKMEKPVAVHALQLPQPHGTGYKGHRGGTDQEE